ncbi:MAG: hypothetical protein RL113_1378 [Pseudomonadota bacterium]
MNHPLWKFGCMALASMVLSGCVNPEFDPYDQGVVFVEGKPYLIPHHSAYRLIRDTRGVVCKAGEVRWIENNTVRTSTEHQKQMTIDINQKYSNVTEEGTAELWESMRSYERQLMRNGLVGCVAPMSKSEYAYYRDHE